MLWTLLEGKTKSQVAIGVPDDESLPSESVCKESPVKPMKEKCHCGGAKKVIPYIIRGTKNLRGECSVCEECDSYSHWPRAK